MANTDLGTIVAHLRLDLQDFNHNLDLAQQQLQLTTDDMSHMAQAGSIMQGLGAAITAGVTVPVMAFGKSAVEATQTFNASMSKTGALMGATQQEMTQLSNAAKEYGASTQFSATECSDALGYMALAGWNANQSISALPGVLNMAAASGMDLAQASDLVTDYLSAFGMEASQAGEMADVLAYAQAHSNTTTEGLGEAFKNCAANAHAAGMDLQTTTALLGQLANQGLKGSEAGTALTAVMRDMTAKMKDGAIQIGNTKVQVQDANGNYRDMIDVLADVESATHGMGDAERAAALQSTFTADSIKGLNLLLNAGSDSAEEFRDKLKDCGGSAEEMAKKMNDNLNGDILACQSAFESMQLEVGQKLDPVLRKAVQTLTKLFSAFSKLPAPVLQVIMVLAGILAVLGPLLLVVGTFFKQLQQIHDGLEMLRAFREAGGFVRVFQLSIQMAQGACTRFVGVITGSVIPALQTLWAFMLANPIVLIIAAIAALILIFTQLWNHCEGFRNFWENLCDNMIDAASRISPALGATVKGIIQVFEGLINVVQTIFKGIKDIIMDIFSGNFDKVGEDFNKMISQLGVNFGEVFDGIKNIARNAIDGLYDLMIAGLGKMFDPIINWGMSINGHLGDVFIDIYGIFEDWFKLIKDIVKDNLKIIGDLFSGDWQGAAEDVGVFFQHLGDNIGNIFNGIKMTVQDAFLTIGSAISQAAQNIWSNVTNWFNTKTAQLGNFFTGMYNSVVNFLESIPDRVLYMLSFLAGVVARGLYEIWNFVTVTIPQWIAQLGIWLSELPGKFSNWLQQTYSRVTDWASKMWAKAQETGQQFVANCIQFIQTLPERIWTWLVNTYNKVTTWANQMWTKAQQAGRQFVNSVVTFIQTLPGRIWTWLVSTIQRAVTFAQQFAAKGQKAATDFKNKIVNGVKSIPGKMKSIGKQIVQGLWNGITGMGSWLKRKISGWANTVIQGFKAGFNIHSPSKRVAEEVGKFLPPGLVVGVKMTADQALKDIRKFADQVMQAAQLGDFANSYQIDTGNLSTTNITNQKGTIAAINDLKRVVQQQNREPDYNKLKDCFVEGAKNIDGTIVMDNTVVGKKVAEPVRSTNKLVLERLNRLEGI